MTFNEYKEQAIKARDEGLKNIKKAETCHDSYIAWFYSNKTLDELDDVAYDDEINLTDDTYNELSELILDSKIAISDAHEERYNREQFLY